MAKHPKDIPRKNKEGVSQHTTHQENWKLVWEMNQATEDLSFQQSPEIKSFKEMVAALQKDTLPSSDSEEEFESDFKLLDSSEDNNNNKFYCKLENN